MDDRSKYLRRLVLSGLEGGGRGHIGSSMSLIELMRVLYDEFLNHSSENPVDPARDRFILSKGHGCLALYAILADRGYFPPEELATFCKSESRLGGHPEYRKVPGIEASTGALGHGLSIGVGMALAAKIRNEPHKTVVLMGDGEINEGSVWEAAMSASKHCLGRLVGIIDNNKLQSYGLTSEVLNMEPLGDKWRAFGFDVFEVDGHSIESLSEVFRGLNLDSMKPKMVICHTIKGKGIPHAEANAEWHHKSNLSEKELESLWRCLD